MFHPAMRVVEEFVAEPAARRLSTTFMPVRAVVQLETTRQGVTSQLPLTGVYVHGGVIRFTDQDCGAGLELSTASGRYLTMGGWWGAWLGGPWPRAVEELAVTYDCGSTITASAREAVLELAHQYWLKTSACEECGACQLPDRTTSVSREGISFTVSDPLDPLSSGGTGLPGVDLWVRGVNPRRVARASGVYTPDAPPPVVVSTQALRNLVTTP